MYTSGNKATNVKTAVYVALSVFVAAFGAVYEAFSHDVWSYFMVYAFAPPLALGALPSVLLRGREKRVGRTAAKLWRAAIAFLTVGMIFAGIIEIYGSDSYFTKYYFIAASALSLLAAAAQLAFRIKNKK